MACTCNNRRTIAEVCRREMCVCVVLEELEGLNSQQGVVIYGFQDVVMGDFRGWGWRHVYG